MPEPLLIPQDDWSLRRRRLDALLGREKKPAPIAPAAVARELEPSHAQRRLWFIQQYAPDDASYNVTNGVWFTGRLARQALSGALRQVVRRHEILRTTFGVRRGSPVQVVSPEAPVPLQWISLEGMPADRSEVLVSSLAEEIGAVAMPMDQALLRCGLITLREDRHCLIVVMHSAVFDAWSGGIFIRDLQRAYQRLARGEPAAELPLALQYADCCERERRRTWEDAFHKHLRALTVGRPASALNCCFPADREERREPPLKGAKFPFALDEALCRDVRSLALREDCSPFVVTLTALALLLSKTLGQEHLTVAVPISNRLNPETEQLIGYFMNLILVPVTVRPGDTGRDLLHSVKAEVLAAMEAREAPFERYVEDLDPTRYRGLSQLARLVFSYHAAPVSRWRLDDMQIDLFEPKARFAKFDWYLSLADAGDRVNGAVEYHAETFDEKSVGRIVEKYLHCLRELCRDSGQLLRTLPITPRDELLAVYAEWNAPAAHAAPFEAVHRRISRQCALHAARPALSGSASLSYEELERQSNQLAHHLIGRGVKPDGIVAFYFVPCAAVFISILAILKAGGAYLPLSPSIPPARRKTLLSQAGARFLVTDEFHRADVDGLAEETIVWDDPMELVRLQPVSPPDQPIHPDMLAYVLFTSGSTGVPKGVAVSHRALSNYLANTPSYAGNGGGSLLHTSVAFDLTVTSFFVPLLTGEAVKIAPSSSDALLAAENRDEETLSLLKVTPSHIQLLKNSGSPHVGADCFVVGGENFSRDLYDFLRARFPQAKIYNEYGPTEATVGCAVFRAEGRIREGAVPIGRPLSGCRLYVVDADNQLVPPGSKGELLIGGESLARGYRNAPRLTAGRFVPDPFSGVPGTRLYRTGDIVRWNNDGQLQFLERNDGQIKARGIRIELEEVAQVFRACPWVRDVLVPRPEAERQDALVAYVIPRLDPDLLALEEVEELQRSHVRQWREIHETSLRGIAPEDPFPAWIDSYDRKPFPPEELEEWLAYKTGLLKSLSPQHILDVGCGFGAFLKELAADATTYYGTDVSRTALELARGQARQIPGAQDKIKLVPREAHRLDGLPRNFFSLAILNSVIQYFPSPDYLRSALERIVPMLRPGGVIFVGDIRDARLLPAYYLSRVLHKASPDISAGEIRQQIAALSREESELAVSPEFFAGLAGSIPGIEAVRVLPVRGRRQNELTRFRYDVLLYSQTPEESVPRGHFLPAPANGACSRDWIRNLLESEVGPIGVRGVANPAVARENAILTWLSRAQAGEKLSSLPQHGDDTPGIEDWLEVAAHHRRAIDIERMSSQSNGFFDVWFGGNGEDRAADVPGPGDRKVADVVASQPLRRSLLDLASRKIHAHLDAHLPRYMQPDRLCLVEQFPLKPNGKLDLSALETEEKSFYGAVRKAPPETVTEKMLAKIWTELLQISEPGRTDDFFQSGGHSLLATQMLARIREQFHVEMSLRSLFDFPTLHRIAEQIDLLKTSSSGGEFNPP